MVMTNMWAIGRDPASWVELGSNLRSSQPERFLNSYIDFKGHDYELIPFGSSWTERLARAKGEDLDVEESPGVTIHKKVPLIAIASLRW
ncbi:hypothetical protein LguiA_009426 [Lonicera macranthoides]